MTMPGRKYTATGESYRYSINGQEREKELNENITTALYWEYDSRIGRRWNVDPEYLSYLSVYATFLNNPLIYIDPDGLYATKKEANEQRDNAKKAGHVVGKVFKYKDQYIFITQSIGSSNEIVKTRHFKRTEWDYYGEGSKGNKPVSGVEFTGAGTINSKFLSLFSPQRLFSR